MTHGSLFSGIGGFDLAAEWMGWENVFHCEWNPFGQRVLKHYWPNATSYEDITKTDFTIWRGRIKILTGGFPCQDISNALQTGGGQKGIEGERTGLIYEFFRAISEINPKYIVAENVSNILKINGGRDFGIILSELARMGYDAEWRVCYASEVGAPHRRGRLLLVAYPKSLRSQGDESFFKLLPKTVVPKRRQITGTNLEINCDNEWLVKSPIYNVVDGISERLDIANTIKSAGNAIVPQVAHQIFKAIQEFENLNNE